MRTHARRVAAAAVLAALATAGLSVPATAAPQERDVRRYLIRTSSPATTDDVALRVRRTGGAVDTVYSRVFSGLSADLSAADAQALRETGGVQSVVPDQIFHTTATQSSPTWGLDRIDQRGVTGNKRYRYDTTGKGVTAYVVDTGVRFGHTQFAGRAVSGPDLVDYDDDAADCQGHGTHVAGTIGGSTYGVAKAVRVVAVRVLDCDGSGYASDIIDGLDWVVAHKPAGPAVVNLSLGGEAFPPIDEAVRRTIAAGVTVVVAAGNDGVDACTESPARVPQAITVAATDSRDRRPSWSNYGRCVDVFAPGVGVRSASASSTRASEVMSGTSMATPHVVGAVARFLQAHPRSTPVQTRNALVAASTARAVQGRQGSPDRLLHTAATAPRAATKVVATKNDRARTATLTWAPPSSNGGSAVTGYRVTRNGSDAAGVGPVTVTVSAATRSHTFRGLKKGSGYSLSVRAVNAVGTSAGVSRSVAALR